MLFSFYCFYAICSIFNFTFFFFCYFPGAFVFKVLGDCRFLVPGDCNIYKYIYTSRRTIESKWSCIHVFKKFPSFLVFFFFKAFSRKLSFYKKLHFKRYRPTKKKNALVILSVSFLQRTKQKCFCLFDKSHTQENITSHPLLEKVWLRRFLAGR